MRRAHAYFTHEGIPLKFLFAPYARPARALPLRAAFLEEVLQEKKRAEEENSFHGASGEIIMRCPKLYAHLNEVASETSRRIIHSAPVEGGIEEHLPEELLPGAERRSSCGALRPGRRVDVA